VLYLLDSNVISELRKAKPHGAVLAWFQTTRREDIGIPSIVLTELQAGAEITRRQDAAKASQLELWIDEIIASWEIVPMDAAIARECARIMEGKSKVLFEDGLIAATARIRQLIVVTRNVKDFAHFGVQVLNPFLTNPTISGSK
jgi:predicted nucleic acid-binding protein